MDQKLKISEVLKKYTMIIALAVIVILFTVNTGGKMLLPQNVNNLIAQNAYVFILATGMLFCILTGGNIDLSVGSVVCFVGAIGGKMMVEMGISPCLTLIAMAIMGMLVGAWQGFWIAYVRIPPFIVTLAGMLMFRGLSNVVLQGMTLAPIPDQFLVLFNTYVPDFFAVEGFNLTCFLVGVIACVVYAFIVFNGRRQKLAKGYYVEPLTGVVIKMAVICVVLLSFMFRLAQYKGIPNALIWVAVIIGIYSYIASKTTTGRYFYAVGGNEKATKLSGINTNRVYFLAYLNMGLLAAIAGMVTVARLNYRQPHGPETAMRWMPSARASSAALPHTAAPVRSPGVIVGATLMGVLNLGMSIMGVDQNLQKVVKGGVLLAAVIFDVVSKRKSFIVK